jgi:hypothetical protein
MAHLKQCYVCRKFCFKLGKNAAKTFHILKEAFGEKTVRRTMGITQIFMQFSQLQKRHDLF